MRERPTVRPSPIWFPEVAAESRSPCRHNRPRECVVGAAVSGRLRLRARRGNGLRLARERPGRGVRSDLAGGRRRRAGRSSLDRQSGDGADRAARAGVQVAGPLRDRDQGRLSGQSAARSLAGFALVEVGGRVALLRGARIRGARLRSVAGDGGGARHPGGRLLQSRTARLPGGRDRRCDRRSEAGHGRVARARARAAGSVLRSPAVFRRPRRRGPRRGSEARPPVRDRGRGDVPDDGARARQRSPGGASAGELGGRRLADGDPHALRHGHARPRGEPAAGEAAESLDPEARSSSRRWSSCRSS